METPKLLKSEVQIIAIKPKDGLLAFASYVINNIFIPEILPFILHLKIQIAIAL